MIWANFLVILEIKYNILVNKYNCCIFFSQIAYSIPGVSLCIPIMRCRFPRRKVYIYLQPYTTCICIQCIQEDRQQLHWKGFPPQIAFHAFCVQPIMNLKHWMLVEVAIVMSWVLAGRSCHFCETGSDTLPDPRIHLVAAPASL